MDLAFYAAPGPLTVLNRDQQQWVQALGREPLLLCRVAQGLLVAPGDPFGAGLSEQHMRQRNVRPASALLALALELEPSSPLDHPRPPDLRVVGTCRHYAVLAASFLRAAGIPARARSGFATYFEPSRGVDHWIVEFWSGEERRWVRVDPEYLDRATPGECQPADLRRGEFLAAGEAWRLVRSGRADPMTYGVFGTQNWGAGEIRGNVMRDLACLAAKTEMLPWDEWGPMTDSYAGATGDEFDQLIDEVATATADPRVQTLQRIYERLAVPRAMIS